MVQGTGEQRAFYDIGKPQMKKKSKNIILNAIKRIGAKLNKYPYFFINEEDIRSQLYHKLATHLKHIIKLKYETGEIQSSAIHSDAVVVDTDNTKLIIDLIIYYAKGKIPVSYKSKGKIHFFKKVSQPKSESRFNKNIKRRRLIEIKISKSESRGVNSIYTNIKNDFEKLKDIDSEKNYLILIDRGFKIEKNQDVKENIRLLTENDNRSNIIYIGCPVEKYKKRGIYIFCNGKIKSF